MSGQAGYWSVRANPPVEHDLQTVVFLEGLGVFCLLPATKFMVEFLGIAGILMGRMKGAHAIKINMEDTDPLLSCLKGELRRYGVEVRNGQFDNTVGDNDERHHQN